MSNTEKTKTLGHCQCCGRIQARMASGLMSKHGYTVQQGWFSGVCSGQNHEPLELKRDTADLIIAQVRAECVKLLERHADVLAGRAFPATVRGPWDFTKREYSLKPFADATIYEQRDAVRGLACQLEGRARMGQQFAQQLEDLADRVHGQALVIEAKPTAPAPILIGEVRQLHNRVATVTSVQGGRVYWKDAKGFKAWLGTQAWRKLPTA